MVRQKQNTEKQNEVMYAARNNTLYEYLQKHFQTKGNLSTRGVAGMIGVSHTSLVRGGALATKKLTEKLTQHGFNSGTLISNGWNYHATWLAIEYFAYESQVKPHMAVTMAKSLGAFGVKKALDKATGADNSDQLNQLVGVMTQLVTQVKQQGEVINSMQGELESLRTTRVNLDHLAPGAAIIREHREKLLALPPSQRGYSQFITAPEWLNARDPELTYRRRRQFYLAVSQNQRVQKLEGKLPKCNGKNIYKLHEVDGIFEATYRTVINSD